jgi:hypothetical protein
VVTATGPLAATGPGAATGPVRLPDDAGAHPATGPLASVDPAAAAVIEDDPVTLRLIAVRR